jgi:ERCC4-type nuclease
VTVRGGVVFFAWAWAVTEIGVVGATVSLVTVAVAVALSSREEIVAAGRRVAGVEEPDAEERAKAAYVAGEIGEEEMERRVALAVDSDRQTVRERAERAPGVGPDLSRSVAEEFSTPERLAHADAEEIAERVHGVGPGRAEEIADRFD